MKTKSICPSQSPVLNLRSCSRASNNRHHDEAIVLCIFLDFVLRFCIHIISKAQSRLLFVRKPELAILYYKDLRKQAFPVLGIEVSKQKGDKYGVADVCNGGGGASALVTKLI
ncbi:hypothetical protein L1987_23322 [Smallanthus sonchifolius]|uniref:Uncharacterized protein n=1 Tax=Smallanthus sonchifolius TaxID=185202 RepID=A0ACB9IJ40_9ASTR|nr:hypothetical protein L1987_23322 [Smallanthus sonchifolius]